MKDYFTKYTTLSAMPNQKASNMAKYIYMFIFSCGILNIIQYDNKTEFKNMNYCLYGLR